MRLILLFFLSSLVFALEWESFDRGVWSCYELLTKREVIKFRSYLLCDGARLSFAEKARLLEVVNAYGKKLVISGNSIFVGDFPDPKDARRFYRKFIPEAPCEVENRSVVVRHDPNIGRSAKFKYSIYDLERALKEIEELVENNLHYNELQKENVLAPVREALRKLRNAKELVSRNNLKKKERGRIAYVVKPRKNAPLFDRSLKQKGIAYKGERLRVRGTVEIGGEDYYETERGLIRVRDVVVVE